VLKIKTSERRRVSRIIKKDSKMSNLQTVVINGRNVQVDFDTPATYKQLQHLGRICAGIFPNQSEKPTSDQWSRARKIPAAVLKSHDGAYPSKGWVQKILDSKTPKLPAAIEKLIVKDAPKAKKAKPKTADMDIKDIIALLKAQGLDVVKASE
jgi:hypothetical protein